MDFPPLNTIFGDAGLSNEECNICGGPSGKPLPEVNQSIRVDDATLQECLLAAQQGTVSETFCELLVFFDNFTCGGIQTNPALFSPFCPGFQSTLGVACECNTLSADALPPPVPEEPVVVPGEADGPDESAPVNSSGFLQRILDFLGSFFG